MSFLVRDTPKTAEEPAAEVASGARLVPRITIQAFCENAQTAQLVESAKLDRRMNKVVLTAHNGGLEGAIETYKSDPTPNLILVETTLPAKDIPAALVRLAEVCDVSTRVIVLGHVNDVLLYRELIRSGVSEYLVLPTSAQTIASAIADLFASDGAAPIGRTIAFVGAKGGSGASTIAHNTAWSISQHLRQDVLILDMDLAFGTAGLDFNQDPPTGLAEAVNAGEKMDAVMLDRLITKAANHVNLLTAPATLDRTYDYGARDFEQVIELSQKSTPIVVLDIPHVWNGWVRQTLSTVDEIVIVAEPDLANLRNAKNLADTVKAMRPAEREPLLVLNKVGMPRRPEIAATEFATSIGCRLIGQIGFDAAAFGTAANNGQMLSEVSGNHKSNEVFRTIGTQVSGRAVPEKAGKVGSLSLRSLLKRKQS